jgi:hypothetical protein
LKVRGYDQAAVRLARGLCDGALDVGDIGCTRHRRLHAQGRCGGLDGARDADVIGLSRIQNDRGVSYSRAWSSTRIAE